MASRLYLPSSGTPAISPPGDAGWEITATSFSRRPTSTTKLASAMATVQSDNISDSGQDAVMFQYISAPLAAQTIAAQAIELQMRCRELSNDGDFVLALGIRVVSNDGLTVRGTVLAVTRDTTEMDNTLENRRLTATTSAVAVSAGDRLIIELGAARTDSAGTYKFELRHGDADAADLPENDTDQTDKNPWIEFADTITFSSISVTSVTPDEFITADTGIVIVGTGFEAVQGAGGKVELGSAATYAASTLVGQTETAWGDTSITFTAVQGALSVGTVYLYVTNNAGEVTAGFAVELNEAAAAQSVVLSSAIMSDRTLFAAGGTANRALGRNVSSSDTTPQYLTYTPSSVILGLYVSHIATLIDRLFVLRTGASIQILSAITVQTPTVDATMHANLAEAWWMVTVNTHPSIPGAGTHIINAGTTIYTLSTTAATGDAPVAAATNWAGGGYALGVQDMGDDDGERVWVIRPKNDLAVSMLHGQGEPGEIVSLNKEGTNPKILQMPLAFVSVGMFWNGGGVFTDGHSDYFYKGGFWDMLSSFERNIEDETEQITSAFYTRDGILGRKVTEFSNADGIMTREWLEEYVGGSWTPASKPVAVAAAASSTPIRSTGSLPITQPSMVNRPMRTVYWTDGADWYYVSQPPPSVSPFYGARNDGSGNSGMVYNFEVDGELESPVMYLLEGQTFWLDGIWYGGELRGTDSQVIIVVAEQTGTEMGFGSVDSAGKHTGSGFSATFNERDSDDKHYAAFENARIGDRLQFKVIDHQGSDSTRSSPSGVPFKLFMHAEETKR